MEGQRSKIRLKASKGSTLFCEQSKKDEITVTVALDSVYSKNYANPPIIDGYKHVYGEWYNGFVIENISNGNKFVWIPVGSLEPNGTLDGKIFNEKFGRRNYRNDHFSKNEFYEPLTEELLEQFESVKKYGGFYAGQDVMTRKQAGIKYHLDPDPNIALIQSIYINQELKKPMNFSPIIRFDPVPIQAAKKIEERKGIVTSHLLFGAEYDSILEWILTSNSINFINPRGGFMDIFRYWEAVESYDFEASQERLDRLTESDYAFFPSAPLEKLVVDPHNNFRINNIDNFAGIYSEVTQELQDKYGLTVRYRAYAQHNGFPYIRRCSGSQLCMARVALCLK